MRVCVGAVLLRHRPTPEVLLVKRAPTREWWPGVWDVAGGHRTPGESTEQTLVREMEEELGIASHQRNGPSKLNYAKRPQEWRSRTSCISMWCRNGPALCPTASRRSTANSAGSTSRTRAGLTCRTLSIRFCFASCRALLPREGEPPEIVRPRGAHRDRGSRPHVRGLRRERSDLD